MFDPLHKWLGIPPDQQPPDLYRLLGICSFESDQDVIHAAADKQLAFLHDLSNGTQAAAAEELSNQVSAARLTLVNKKKKAAYDLQLKGILANRQFPTSGSPTSGSPTSGSPASGSPASGSTASGSTALRPPPLPDSDEAAVADRGPPTVIRNLTDWYLRHRDKHQHGPFDFDRMLEAARAGNIAADTDVRHSQSTLDQWVLATSIPEIAQCCPANPMIAASPKTPLVVVSQPRRPARHYQWKAVVRHVFSFLIFFLVPSLLIYQNPRMRQIINTAIGKQETSKNVTVITEPIPAKDRARIPREPIASPIPADPAPIPSPREPSRFVQQASLETTPQARPEIAKLPVEKLVHLKLNMNSTRSIMPLEDTHESGKYFVTTVTHSPGTIELRPSSGELSKDHSTRLAFDSMSSLAVDLRLETVGQPPVLSVTGRWSWQIDSDSDLDFSLNRLKNRERFLGKNLNAGNALQTLSNERKNLALFVNSRGLKTLKAVQDAENRIKVIDSQKKSMQQRAESEKLFIEQFMVFKQSVHQIHERCELVVRHVDQLRP